MKVQEEPDAKEEIILMESDSQEVMQKTPGVQVTLDHCCEAESVVPSAKKIKTDELLQFQYSKTWVKLYKKQLTIKDKKIIILGECLNDLHINFAQEIFKKQFKHILGFQSTLVLAKCTGIKISHLQGQYLQIIHCRECHWIVASVEKLHMEDIIRITIYDSIFLSIDDETSRLLTRMFGKNDVVMGKAPKQEGNKDCGVYAIATCVSLANGTSPHLYDQTKMRGHLIQCFENLKFTKFP